MSSTPEANSPTAQLTKLSLSTAALPRYQFDQLKAETLLRQFLPGIDVDIQMTAERIAVTVMTSHPLQSIELWSGLTRSLALQLGVEVELRRCAIDPYLSAEQTDLFKKIVLRHGEVVSVDRIGDSALVSVIGVASSSLRSALAQAVNIPELQLRELANQEQLLPIVAPATIQVEVNRGNMPSPLIIARQYLIASALDTKACIQTVVLSKLSETLKPLLPDALIEVRGRSLYIKAEAQLALLESAEFYQLTQQLSAQYAGQYAILLQIVLPPEPFVDPFSEQASLAGVARARALLLRSATKYLFTKFGTRAAFEVSLDDSASQLLVRVIDFNNPNVTQLCHSAKLQRPPSLPTLVFTEWSIPSEELIQNSARRETITRSQLLQIRDRVCDIALVDQQGDSWATVQVKSNTIVLKPVFPITESLRKALAERFDLIPALIIVENPKVQIRKLSQSDVKSLTKLLLPHGPAIQSIDKDRVSGSIVVQISCSMSQLLRIENPLNNLFSSLPLNSIEFKPELLDEQLAKEISFISSRHKKLFVNSCSPEGRIELATWNNPNEISRAHKRGAGSRENVSEILSRHSHKLVDYTHLNVISCDPQGAHLIEDAISLERLADGCYRIGMHVVNAALLTEEFSYDRFYSYRKGSTVYSDRGVTASMIPQQQRCSLIAGVARPAISVFLNFRSDGSELILDSERSAQIEATIIENKHQLRYEHSSTKKIANIPAALIPDLQLLERVGQQLANATHANVDAYSTLEPGSPFVSQILAYSNHLIAKELGRVQLNAIYQVGEKPTVRDFQNILKQFPAELRQKLLDSEITDIYHDDRQVHALMMRMFKYQQSLNLHNVDLSRFREQASIDPRAGSFRSGYSPYLIANTGARRLISMVAQHQISASLGICSPLSRPEVEALLRLETEHRRVAPRLRRELDLFNDLAALAKAARLAEPLEARVIDIEEGGVPVVSVQVNDRKKYFGRLEPRSQINPGRKLNVDEQVYVLPSSYNLIYDTFTFRRT